MRLVGWAIVHSLWQGGVIALVSAGLLAATRRSRPVVRYSIALASLTAMVALPIATALLSEGAESTSDISAVTTPAAIAGTPAPSSATGTTETIAIDPTVTLSTVGSSASSAFDAATVAVWIENALPFLVAAWMLGLLIASARLIGGFARTRSVSRKSTSPASHALEIRVEKLCARLGITRALRILESTSIDVPLVVGAIRPVIVVPLSLVTGLTPIQLDMLLAHELAHVRRHDYLINLIQTVFETLLFYHPAARWISERAREERENCCDDVAINACGVDARAYTETLLVLEEARDQGFGLAAAATGGSLLRRAQRLLSGKPAYLELGPRWMAGVVTIGAGLFAGNDALAAIQAAYLPVTPIGADKDSTGKSNRPDASRARPSTVIRPTVGGSLSERWRWAEKNSGSNDYWIGYLIAGDQSGKSKFYMSELPVRLDGDVTMTGRMNLGDGDISNFLFIGTPLTPLLGDHDRHSVALFFRVKDGALGSKIDLVHAGTYTIPGYFGNRPLVWLDSATDAESIALVRSLLSRAGSSDTRRDLVSALGVHRDARAVAPILIDLVNSRNDEDIRKVAVEWLGRGGDPRGIGVVSRVARTDRSEDVRREAIQAFGNMSEPSGTDSLIAFVNSLDQYDLRREAIEALGERRDPRALSFMTTFARSSASTDLRRQAVEALANMPGGGGMNVVIDIARTDPSADVRREAIESIGELEPSSRALDVLQQIARTDRDGSARSEAVETIAEVHDPRTVAILANIANNSDDEDIIVEAVESLGETVAPEAALPILRQIVRKHPNAEARKKALETIIGFKEEAIAIDEIVYAVRNDTDESVRKSALEALGDASDPVAMRTLVSFIDGQYPYDIREAALEVYTDATDKKTAAAMLRQVMTKDRDERLRARAAEMLDDR